MLANQEEDRERKAFDLISADRSYQQSRKLIDFALTFSSLDPFACSGHNGRKTSRYTELMRERWVKFAFVLTIYLACKPMTVLLVRSIRGRLVGGKNRELIGELDLLLRLTGDSFAYPPLLNSIFYMFIPILGLCIRCYLPIYLKKVHPYNCSLARFMLEPSEEIRYYDLQALQIVTETMKAIERRRREIYYSLRFESDRQVSRIYHIDLLTIQRQLSQMRLVKQQVQHIRPSTLRLDWHRRICKTTTAMIPLLATTNMLIISLGVLHFAIVGWRSRCNQMTIMLAQNYSVEETSWPECRLFDAFNLADLLMILEMILLSIVSITAPVSVLIIFHVMQIQHQLHMSEDIGRKLHSLLADLRGTETTERIRSSDRSPTEKLTSRLFANLIGLRMFERESGKCVVMLAHSTRVGVFGLFSFTAVAFVALRSQSALNDRILLGQVDAITAASSQTDLQLSIVLITIAWIFTFIQQTAVLFSCAAIPARSNRLDRMVYSLMAELIRIQSSNRNVHDLEQMECREQGYSIDDPVTSLWRRLALSRNVDGHPPSVRILSTSLTYKRVLEIQFYLVTIVHMLFSYV